MRAYPAGMTKAMREVIKVTITIEADSISDSSSATFTENRVMIDGEALRDGIEMLGCAAAVARAWIESDEFSHIVITDDELGIDRA